MSGLIPRMLPMVAVSPLTLPLCLKNFRSSAKKYIAKLSTPVSAHLRISSTLFPALYIFPTSMQIARLMVVIPLVSI